jgi:RNA polymerase sigma factor (sigma-70 family)
VPAEQEKEPLPDKEQLKKELEEAWQALRIHVGPEAADPLWPILLVNLARNRVEYYLKLNSAHRVADYVKHVANTYEATHRLIESIQVEKNTLVWRSLIRKLERWAYFYLSKHTNLAHPHSLAADYAHEAAIQLLRAHFPYDTLFDPWANQLVQTVCLKQWGREKRAGGAADSQLAYLEELLTTVADPHQAENQELVALRVELLAAIEKLPSPDQKIVIQLRYFDQLPPKEIALRMNRKITAIYRLNFTALEELRKILKDSGYKGNKQ